jgi:hypothetical protein
MASRLPGSAPARSPGIAFVLAILGLGVVVFGWMVPSQFKSLPVSVLAEAGRGTDTLRQIVRDELDAGRPGTAAVFAQAAGAIQLPGADSLTELVRQYQLANTDIAAWGEANAFLQGAVPPNAVKALDPSAGVIRHFLPAATRRSLTTYLANSRSSAVKALLQTRDLATWRQFLPIHSAGGAPLETTILLTAMLVASDEVTTPVARELRALAEEAVATGEAAKIEMVYLDVLSLGQRYTWGQLAALTRDLGSLENLARLRHLHKLAPDFAPVQAAAAILTERPDAVIDYVVKYGERGNQALAFALFNGRGSIDLLVRQDLPPDGNLEVPAAATPTGLLAYGPLVRFALRDPQLAVGCKIAAYLLGGLLLFLGAERITALRHIELSRTFTTAARAVGAAGICVFLIVINEPYLALGSEPSGFELKLVIPVLGAATDSAMPNKAFSIDVPTILSISFFFLIQALVFLICLLKLREIDGKPVPPQTKLRLTENEENLFDSGLYVGIAGTCIALVLQVLGLIEANLLAAYSSNLFGILGVAFVKIRHVRPFKQRLILLAEEHLTRLTGVAAGAGPATVDHQPGIGAPGSEPAAPAGAPARGHRF